MKKLYCIICGKCRKFQKLKISYLLETYLVLSIICSKYQNENVKIFNPYPPGVSLNWDVNYVLLAE